jgi:urease accessory protein
MEGMLKAIIIIMTMVMTTGIIIIMIDAQTLLKLQTWFSPAFPIGAFSYSHGLEAAIEAGDVFDRSTLTKWLQDLLLIGSGRTEAAFFKSAHGLANYPVLAAALASEAAAWSPTAELTLESDMQGEAFLKTIASVWPKAEIINFQNKLKIRPPLPVAAGFVAGVHSAPLEVALSLYLQAFIANIVSAGVRLVPLGQTDGQHTIASLERSIADAVEGVDDIESLWTATPMLDVHSMKHETQYTRIFRS